MIFMIGESYARILDYEQSEVWFGKAIQAIKLIEKESISFGLTDKVEDFLKHNSDLKEV